MAQFREQGQRAGEERGAQLRDTGEQQEDTEKQVQIYEQRSTVLAKILDQLKTGKTNKTFSLSLTHALSHSHSLSPLHTTHSLPYTLTRSVSPSLSPSQHHGHVSGRARQTS